MNWSDTRLAPAARVLMLGCSVFVFVLGGCGGSGGPEGEVQIVVPEGASAGRIARVLEDADLIGNPRLFSLVARFKGSAADLKSGTYLIPGDAGYFEILDILEAGAVETVAFTAPEGFTADQIAPLVAEVSGVPVDSVLALTTDSAFATELGVPGPDLEGYLFPETYRVAVGLAPRSVLKIMVDKYRSFWTPERLAIADSTGLSEREIVTLASIVEREARVVDEMPTIAGVYSNRLEIGMLLQADPTVQYALGSQRARLLYASIDSVADNPYNTYTHPGLPPGPIASPGEAALAAALQPADVPFLFFVARADGSHEFTRTNREHINAKNRIRGEASRAAAASRAAEDAAGGAEGGDGDAGD
ncbi:MAG: endolytic transglycosylase MltG [Gemmatimonadota bacterium]